MTFPVVCRVTHSDFGTVQYFPAVKKKKKVSVKRPMWTGSICASSPAPGLPESQGQPTLRMFQHHLLLTGHCFPKRYYCFRLSLEGDVTFAVTSEMPGRFALRSGVYNYVLRRMAG